MNLFNNCDAALTYTANDCQ